MAVIKPEFFSELPRYKKLSRLRKYYDGTQYEGRPDFFTGLKPNGEIAPLRERKPCIIYPLPRAAVSQVVKFTFGESRFPKIGAEKVDAENAIGTERLSEEEAEQLEKFCQQLVERCELKPAMRRVMRPGVAVGTACCILSLRNGLIQLTVPNAEDVLPEFRDGVPGGEVIRAVWAYQYVESVPSGSDGRPESKRFWFRQDITEAEFVEYEPIEVKPNEPPAWRVSRTVAHGFGFCPFVWIRNVSDADSREIDGSSVYSDLEDEFDALNFALSQRHRGLNLWGVPQPWVTGVEDGDGPPADGRRAGPAGFSPASESPHGKILGSDGRPAIRVSSDNQWQYTGVDTKVGLLETTGKPFEAGTNHVNDIRSRALEAMSVVLVNVSDVMGRTQQGQMSAKFLELAYEPLLALVDEMRHCWWPQGLRAIVSAALRIVAATKGKNIYIPGAAAIAPILDRFFVKTDDGKTLWLGPSLQPAWGDYFAAGPEEISAGIKAAKEAEGLVPHDDRAKYVLPYFGREDTEDALAELEKEKEEAEEKAAADADREVQGAIAVVDAKAKASNGAAGGKASAPPPR